MVAEHAVDEREVQAAGRPAEAREVRVVGHPPVGLDVDRRAHGSVEAGEVPQRPRVADPGLEHQRRSAGSARLEIQGHVERARVQRRGADETDLLGVGDDQGDVVLQALAGAQRACGLEQGPDRGGVVGRARPAAHGVVVGEQGDGGPRPARIEAGAGDARDDVLDPCQDRPGRQDHQRRHQLRFQAERGEPRQDEVADLVVRARSNRMRGPRDRRHVLERPRGGELSLGGFEAARRGRRIADARQHDGRGEHRRRERGANGRPHREVISPPYRAPGPPPSPRS